MKERTASVNHHESTGTRSNHHQGSGDGTHQKPCQFTNCSLSIISALFVRSVRNRFEKRAEGQPKKDSDNPSSIFHDST